MIGSLLRIWNLLPPFLEDKEEAVLLEDDLADDTEEGVEQQVFILGEERIDPCG